MSYMAMNVILVCHFIYTALQQFAHKQQYSNLCLI